MSNADIITKSEAIAALGGTVTAAATAIGITPQAVSQWPPHGPLPPVIRDRVQAAMYRSRRVRTRTPQQRSMEAPAATPLL